MIEKRKPGRQTIRTPEMIESILERISNGEPLAQICRDEGMPCVAAVNKWRDEDAEFDSRFARAREVGHDAIAAESLRIIDEDPEYVITTIGGDATEKRIDAASVQRAKNRAEHRLKLLAKWDRRYSERVTHGGDAENPITVAVKAIERRVVDADPDA